MIEKKIVIAALARDCEGALIANIPLIEQVRSNFQFSEVVVVENDSVDRTKEILSDWAHKEPGVHIISQNYGTTTIPGRGEVKVDPMQSFGRIEKMAFYRNIYLNYIARMEVLPEILIVIDIDVMRFSVDVLVNSLDAMNKETGAIFSNGVSLMKTAFGQSRIYYDIFAVWEYPERREFSYTASTLAQTFKSVNINISKQPFYPVISAFGGVGIYNYEAIKDLRYKALPNPINPQEAICEHIPFNHQIVKSGYKNYIARDFHVLYEYHNWTLILKQHLPARIFNYILPLILKLKKRL